MTTNDSAAERTSNIVRRSISIDSDLFERAKEESRKYSGRFGEINLSAYINKLLREDLEAGISSKSQAGPGALLKDAAPRRKS